MGIMEVFAYNRNHQQKLKEICSSLRRIGFSGFFYHKIMLKEKHITSLSTSLQYLKYWHNSILQSKEYQMTIKKTLFETHCKLLITADERKAIIANFDLSCDQEYIENWGVISREGGIKGINLYLNTESSCRKFLLLFRHKVQAISECEANYLFFDFGHEYSTNEEYSIDQPKIQQQYMIMGKKGAITLTLRQVQILGYLAKNLSVKEIARKLNLTIRGIEFHMSTIKSKTLCTCKSQLTDLARKNFLDKLTL